MPAEIFDFALDLVAWCFKKEKYHFETFYFKTDCSKCMNGRLIGERR